jgi:alpha-beta hydrolase superfamily lysophospholipase
MNRNWLLLLFCFLLFIGCRSDYIIEHEVWIPDNHIDFTEETVQVIKKELKPLILLEDPFFSENIQKYFKYYDIDYAAETHYFGTYASFGKNIACHIYLLEESRGTILLIHGYLEHGALSFTKLIPVLLEEGFTVALIDLPGHGFSEGKRGDIDDFSEYAAAIDQFFIQFSPYLPEPFHIVGHSMGSAAIMEYLYQYNADIKTCILTAPLVRIVSWRLVKFCVYIFTNVIYNLNANTTRHTYNVSLSEFLKDKDPLYIKKFPVSWVRAMCKWEKRFKKNYSENNTPVIIIQGEKDRVLDWEYNLHFLKKKFPYSTLFLLEEANHALYTEIKDIRDEVIELTLRCLSE